MKLTPEERAERVLRAALTHDGLLAHQLAREIREAICEERETCLGIIDRFGRDEVPAAIAREIRERPNP